MNLGLLPIYVCGSLWNRHIWITMEVCPCIRVVIYGYDLSTPPVKEVRMVGHNYMSST